MHIIAESVRIIKKKHAHCCIIVKIITRRKKRWEVASKNHDRVYRNG